MFLSDLLPDKKLALLCIVICDSEGVMYWGDADIDVLETAYINGSGRRPLLTETNSHYFAFFFHDGNIYITDWAWPYVCLCSFASDPCDMITNNRGTDTAELESTMYMYFQVLRLQFSTSVTCDSAGSGKRTHSVTNNYNSVRKVWFWQNILFIYIIIIYIIVYSLLLLLLLLFSFIIFIIYILTYYSVYTLFTIWHLFYVSVFCSLSFFSVFLFLLYTYCISTFVVNKRHVYYSLTLNFQWQTL